MKKNIISTVIALVLAVAFGVGVGYVTPPFEARYFEYEGENWKLGYGREEITPDDWKEKTYYIAGFMDFPYNPMEENLDGMFVRAVAINDGTPSGTVVYATIDCVGIAYEDVLDIRRRVNEVAKTQNVYNINVFATHTHHCLDTQGLWGEILSFKSGLIPEFMERVKTKTVNAIVTAIKGMKEGELTFARIEEPAYFRDSREPQVMDPSVNRFRFKPLDGSRETYIVNLAAHPESLGQSCRTLTSDYPYYIEKELNANNIDMLFINGAIGGLIGYRAFISAERIERMQDFGKQMAQILIKMGDGTKIKNTLKTYTKIVRVPITNGLFELVFTKGLTSNKAIEVEGKSYKYDYDTEINYYVFGDNIKIAALPGEIFPELIIGGCLGADEAINGTETEAPLFKDMVKEGDYALCFGMSNDAIGYVLPENDFLENNLTNADHYEEMISLGKNTGLILMQNLQELVKSAA